MPVIAGVAGFGIARYAADSVLEEARALARHHGQFVQLKGAVAAEPDVRPERVQLNIRPHWIKVSGGSTITQTRGLILVRVLTTTLRYGDVVEVGGILGAPPRLATFDYRLYLARRDVLAWIARPASVRPVGEWDGNPLLAALLEVRDRVRKSICDVCLPASTVLTGILIGDESFIPPELVEDFRRTGTSHIVAISGFNVSIVIALVVALLSRVLNRRQVALVALPAVAVYVVFVGASASVVRAGVMAGIALVGMALYRQGFTLNTLCAAATLILAFEPQMLFDVGFQLSFAATLGLVLFADRLSRPSRLFWEQHIHPPRVRQAVNFLADGGLVTLAAQATTLPLLMAYFGQIPLTSILVNVLILPLQPPIMILGSLGAAVATLLPAVRGVALFLPCKLMEISTLIIRWGSGWAVLLPAYQVGQAGFVAYYAVLLGALWWLEQPRAVRSWALWSLRLNAKRWAAVAGVLVTLVVAMVYWFQRPDGKLRVTFAGASALLSTPSGHTVLFVGGGPLLDVLQRAMPAWDSAIELMVMPTAEDSIKRDALEVLRRYRAQYLILPPDPPPDPEASPADAAWRAEWEETLRERVMRVERLVADASIVVDNVPITVVLRRPRSGAQALGLNVHYGAMRLEIAGDYTPLALQAGLTDLFISPRALPRRLAAQLSVQRVIWADRGGAPPELVGVGQSIWLRRRDEAQLIVGTDGKARLAVR